MEAKNLKNVGYVQDVIDTELMNKLKETVNSIKENLKEQKSFVVLPIDLFYY